MNTYLELMTAITERNEDLGALRASEMLHAIIEKIFTPVQTAALLVALRAKGETSAEILGFIHAMREFMIPVSLSSPAIDTCGTGGDRSNSFNISTATAFVAKAGGAKVAKHGNRAASSVTGSADVLETLGMRIPQNAKEVSELFDKRGITFMFAPFFHPAMRAVKDVRTELGMRTIFNFLGPFLNPAGVRRQLIGAPTPEIAEKLADVAAHLDYEHTLIVSSRDKMDEISVSAPTRMYEVRGKQVKRRVIVPTSLGFKHSNKYETKGGFPHENAAIIREIFYGKLGAKRDVVLINSAAALYVAGKVPDMETGKKLATEVIFSGAALKKLDEVISRSQKIGGTNEK